METQMYYFFVTATVLLFIALYFWADISTKESPLMTLTRKSNYTMATLLTLALGLASMVLFENGFAILAPEKSSYVIYRCLFVLYVPLFGVAQVIVGGLFLHSHKESKNSEWQKILDQQEECY
jgi:hypothetical protein